MTLLLGATAARDKGGCFKVGGAEANRGHLFSLFPTGSEPLWEEVFGQCPSFSVTGASPTLPLALLPTTKHHATGAIGAGGGDWERKEGGREKVGPVKGQNLSRKNISADTLPRRIPRQKHQRVLLNIRGLVTFVWDGAMSVWGEAEEGDAHLPPELLRVEPLPAQLPPPPGSSRYRQKPPIHRVEAYGKSGGDAPGVARSVSHPKSVTQDH